MIDSVIQNIFCNVLLLFIFYPSILIGLQSACLVCGGALIIM